MFVDNLFKKTTIQYIFVLICTEYIILQTIINNKKHIKTSKKPVYCQINNIIFNLKEIVDFIICNLDATCKNIKLFIFLNGFGFKKEFSDEDNIIYLGERINGLLINQILLWQLTLLSTIINGELYGVFSYEQFAQSNLKDKKININLDAITLDFLINFINTNEQP